MLLQTLVVTAALCAPQDPGYMITGAKVLAPEGDRWLEDAVVTLESGRIVGVGPLDEIDFPVNVSLIDLEGLYLVPGLIDLHSHLLLHPYDETTWNDQVLKESLEARTIRATAAAKATVEAGWTTLRELGTEGAGYADVALRDSIAAGIVPGPRIFAATRALVATGCYGPSGFDPRWDVPKGAQVADGPHGPGGVRVAVRQQIAGGADWIKVYADYRRKPGDPSTPTYSLEELRAIVDEAASAKLPVAAHASTDEAILRAVAAGVKTIEHGYDASFETLVAMKDAGVVLCPTLTASESIARYSGWTPDQPDHPRILKARALIGRALRAGVTIACGSDAGVFRHGENTRELELLVAYGLTPPQALRTATTIAADVLGHPDLGRIAPGAHADLVAFRNDPLASPSALRDPVLVVRAGTIVVDRL